VGTWGIVVAAGAGSRFGGDKLTARVGSVRLVDRALEVARRALDAVVLVVPPGAAWVGPDLAGAVTAVVPGGCRRSDSVRAGLGAVPTGAGEADVIVVHDAARPFASVALYRAVIAAVADGADGAVPALPVDDTIKRVSGREVLETLARDELVRVQTPQAFRSAILRAAHAPGGDATDDAALVERLGGRVVTVPGEVTNLKITRPADLRVARALLALGDEDGRHEDGAVAGAGDGGPA